MNKEQLLDRIAHLESVNDQLKAELSYIDGLMRLVGFDEGLATIRDSAYEMHDADEEDFENNELG